MEEHIKKILFDELPKTHYGEALRIYFGEEIDKLVDVTTVQSWDDTLGRKKAVEFLKKVLKFLQVERLENSKKTDYK